MLIFFLSFQGRDSLNSLLHLLLHYSILACLVAVAFEMYYVHNVVAGLARAGATLLQAALLN
jgi:hypothetical protein